MRIYTSAFIFFVLIQIFISIYFKIGHIDVLFMCGWVRTHQPVFHWAWDEVKVMGQCVYENKLLNVLISGFCCMFIVSSSLGLLEVLNWIHANQLKFKD